MKLVVAVPPRPTESLAGYLLRLTEANGYPNFSYVVAAATRRWTYAPPAALDPRLLTDVVGLTDLQIKTLTMIPESGGRGLRRIRGIDLPRSELSVGRPKVCPRCLAEAGCCEAFWDLAQAVACPIHSTVLINECPHCHKPLDWRRGKVGQCRCGANLTEIEAPQASKAIITLMRVMRHFLYEDAHVAAMPAGTEHLRPLGLARLCKLLWVMSSDLRNQAGGKCPKARDEYRVEREQVAEALCEWPTGFRKLLSAAYEPRVTSAPVPPSFAWTFSWLFARLVAKDVRVPDITDVEGQPYGFLVEEVCRFGAQYWLHKTVESRGVADGHASPVSARWGTRLEAARALGVRLPTLNKLIGKGIVPTRAVSASKTRAHAVDMDAISGLVGRNVRKVIHIRRAAKAIGLSISTLQEIRKGNLCGLEPRLTFSRCIDSAELEMLTLRLKGLAVSRHVPHDGVSRTIRQGFTAYAATSRERATFFDRLLANPSWAVGCNVAGTWEDRLYVELPTFDAFFAQTRTQCSFISMADAAKRLHCVNNVAVALRRAGHLQSERHQSRLWPTTESVDAFDRKYESAAAIARRIGVTSTWMYWHADFSAVRHLEIRSLQHTSVFVERSEVPDLEHRMRALMRGAEPERTRHQPRSACVGGKTAHDHQTVRAKRRRAGSPHATFAAPATIG